MSIATFGVTAAAVKQHHLPQLADFSANSSPSSTTVGTMISDAAAEVGGVLVRIGVDPADLTADTIPYQRCAGAVRLGAAAAALRASTQANPDGVRELQRLFEKFLKDLEAGGAAWLGDESLDGSDAGPGGPSTHVSRLNLTVDDEADNASSVAPTLRMSDEL